MDSDKDHPDDGPSAQPAPNVKRPHAILDLEATEVAPPGPAMIDAPDEDATGNARVAEAISAESGADAARPVEAETEDAPEETPRGSGEARSLTPSIWGLATHLVAGVAGGVAALLLYAALTPNLQGLEASVGDPGAVGALARRLDTLEQAMPLPASPQIAEKLASAEDRLAKLEEAQSRLAGEAKSLADRQGKFDGAGVEARLAKLENQLGTLAASSPGDASAGPMPQLAAVASKLADIEARAVRAEEAARAASGDLGAVKARMAATDELIAAIKTESGRNGELARAATDDAAAVRGAADGLAAKMNRQLEAAAKPGDIAAAVAPVSAKLVDVERRLNDVAGSEESRRVNAERILLTLELAGLKRAIERGEGYAREFAEVRATSAGKWDLTALDRSSGQGVATLAALEREFRDVEPAIMDAAAEPADRSVFSRLLAGAQSVVRVRRIDHAADDLSASAVLGRMKKAIEAGRLDGVIAESKQLPPAAHSSARAWLDRVEARHAVDAAIAKLENQLRTSLASPGAPETPIGQ